jgi:hypothetical protein
MLFINMLFINTQLSKNAVNRHMRWTTYVVDLFIENTVKEDVNNRLMFVSLYDISILV